MGSFGDKLNVIKKLEEEKRKLESCQLDVPLTLQILNDAILNLKEEKKRRSEMQTQQLLKDFIPLNKCIREEDMELLKREELMREKKFQQWKANDDHILNRRFSDTKIKNNKLDIERIEERSSMLLIPNVETGLSLGLASSLIKRNGSLTSCGITSNSTPQPQPQPQPQPLLQQQASRKQRRKWDDELHGGFVHALQQLGGPWVATPKQIREHMQVEGLTNDEVKSHLQKYRIHIRVPNSYGEEQSGVFLGFNLWNSSQEGGESSNKSNSQSDSPQGPLQSPSTTTTTGGDSSMEDAKSEGFLMERLRSP